MVSVVVPTYNNVAYVARTVESILGQTYSPMEVVIADHASTDGTWDVVSSFERDERVRLLRTEPGGGAHRNWNRVTDAASGTFVKLVCADDLLYPTCLQEQVEAMMQHPEAVMAACRRDIVDAKGELLLGGRGLPGMSGQVEGPQAVRAAVRAGTNIFGEPACVLFRTDVVREVGGWSPAEYLIDMDLYVRVLGRGPLVALDRTLAAFRVSRSQWSVALVAEQGRQAHRFHRQLREAGQPGLSEWDARVGMGRAYGNAVARRLLYTWWGSRLTP